MKTEALVSLIVAGNAAATADWKQQRRRLTILLAASLLLMSGLFTGFIGLRADLGPASAAVARKEGVTLLALASGLAALWHLSRPDVTRRLEWLIPAGAALLLVLWEVTTTDARSWSSRMIGSNALVCLITIPLLALPMLAALLLMLRKVAPANPAAAGAMAGVAAAGGAASLYALHCTDDSALFVALWYSLATLILATAGALAAQRFVRW